MLITERSTYPASGDINKCCGQDTVIQKYTYEVNRMTQPPHTYDRFLDVFHWQCKVVFEHRGQVWITTDEEE